MPISVVLVSVAKKKPTYRIEQIYWPILRMSDWVRVLLDQVPQVLLCGKSMQNTTEWQACLQSFWKVYEETDGEHCVFSSGYPLEYCIPYFLHGDEGRTHRTRSFMIESFQPVISYKGPNKTNESGLFGAI